MSYKIGKFAQLVNISIDTLRYYEKMQLIIPKRDKNNLRIYDYRDVEWIKFIKRLKATGMSIKNIQIYAKLRYQGDSTIDQRLHLLYGQKNILKTKQEKLQSNIDFLNHKIGVYQKMKNKIINKNKKI
ncbi:MerR family transcriptional regulator [Lactobacillus acetotolerans]|jgi:DNA-binding transcriptional MerR regulator|uniref:Transcriptional regulator n=1 Tax=Lactobacillus acetotolerans TaxID=1600 RepID=A0A0D6A2C3_9LACO|nr:MerR family transcriptional regulator [Lactobacillus acetotolerans]MBN7276568.1 MerR family transcriptional regulator [Lactobacillus acetotolerans]QGV04846.1 MerR family transcriptional regulator [Lactobacillus acetotolerans]QJD73748.1 MerR family transcriptional regulator [Lactobacillus acetotolerans]BAQ56977.1 transcriptional regulator [Lactobacillus acetotolerans]HBG91165.1 MerR family transcriptional regulator [Lactobacillus acetotolerans]